MNPPNSDPAALAEPGLAPLASAAGSNGSPDDRGQESTSEERPYDPVPPRKSVTMAVRYGLRGRGRPLPYPPEEEDGE